MRFSVSSFWLNRFFVFLSSLFVFIVSLSVSQSVCLSVSRSLPLTLAFVIVTLYLPPMIPKTKHTTSQTAPPPESDPKGVKMIFLPILHVYGEISCFLHPHKHIFEKMAFSNNREDCAICVSPILSRQPSRHKCTPPKQKTLSC